MESLSNDDFLMGGRGGGLHGIVGYGNDDVSFVYARK